VVQIIEHRSGTNRDQVVIYDGTHAAIAVLSEDAAKVRVEHERRTHETQIAPLELRRL
jgi:hypothetical protein